MKLDFPEGTLRPIDARQLDAATARAAASPRRRAITRYHDHPERIQRMLNALEPDTYARPHRHLDPPKVEAFVALRGAAAVVRFDDSGAVREVARLAPGGPCQGVEIPPGTWHTVVCLAPGTVLFEVLEGPYEAATHKDFAPWAPAEGDPGAAAWLAALRAEIL
jgi:cupin fold WbuC family metalloprotein